MHLLDVAWGWVNLALTLFECVILPALILVGCYVYLQRSAATHFGIAGEFEREGNLAQALKHYELAAKYAKRSGEGNAAKAKAAEVRGRMAAHDEAREEQ
jgi:hypothetical protein